MKELNGRELSGYMKANQAHTVKALRSRKIHPKLIIIRDNDHPVIRKYVQLKRRYGEDIGVAVEDWLCDNISKTREHTSPATDLNVTNSGSNVRNLNIADAIQRANASSDTHGIIVQLPLKDRRDTDTLINQLAPTKDVDGLGTNAEFDSATATAINWLLAGYDIDLEHARIALVGRGKLVGGPLEKMWRSSGYDVTTFGHTSDLSELKNYDIIVSATGVPHLITSAMVKPGAVVVDAGTASEGGVLVGDVSEEVRARTDLAAITPKVGGVGPLTVTALFEHVLNAAGRS